MFITTKGIVLRTYPFKDNQIITKVFTKDYGVISCIVRKKKSHLVLSQILTIINLTYRQKKSSTLTHLKEVNVDYVYKTLNVSIAKIQCSIILCEILNKCLKEVNQPAHDFIVTAFKYLDCVNKTPPNFVSFFLIKFCQIMGISPLTNNFKHLKNPTLDIREGGFVEYRTHMINDLNFVPPTESLEIYNLSFLELAAINTFNLDYVPSPNILRYMILYISSHLADVSHLKSLEVVNELIT